MVRIIFTSIGRAKKAAKLLSTVSEFPLSTCQQEVAKACGYRDWHDLEASIPAQAGVAGQAIPIDVEIGLIAKLAGNLRLAAGAVQHAITTARLLGTSKPNLRHAVEVRRQLFVKTDLPPSRQGEPGWVVETKVRGQKKETAIIRGTGREVLLVMRSSDGAARGDNEIKNPREPLPLFIPWRLYFPYGFCTEGNGGKVVFSRDYHPMWRIRTGQAPERLQPWEQIYNHSMQHFWGDRPIDLGNPDLESDALDLLENLGVRSMPQLVDLLPSMIHENLGIRESVSEAKKRHMNSLAATT